MSEQPMDAADRKLLLAIIESASQTPDWNLVAFMVGKTPEAVHQHFLELRKTVVFPDSEDSDAEPTTTTTTTTTTTAARAIRKRKAAGPAAAAGPSTKRARMTRSMARAAAAEQAAAEQDEVDGKGADAAAAAEQVRKALQPTVEDAPETDEA